MKWDQTHCFKFYEGCLEPASSVRYAKNSKYNRLSCNEHFDDAYLTPLIDENQKQWINYDDLVPYEFWHGIVVQDGIIPKKPKRVPCDWCSSGGSMMTDCGEETCDHCGGTGKCRRTKTQLAHYYNAGHEVDQMSGKEMIIPIDILIRLGLRLLFEKDCSGDFPMMIIRELEIQ